MNPWTTFIIGLFVGWIIEYALDWFYWRRKPTDEQIVADLQNQLRAAEERAAGLEARLAELSSDRSSFSPAHATINQEQSSVESEALLGVKSDIEPQSEEPELQDDYDIPTNGIIGPDSNGNSTGQNYGSAGHDASNAIDRGNLS